MSDKEAFLQNSASKKAPKVNASLMEGAQEQVVDARRLSNRKENEHNNQGRSMTALQDTKIFTEQSGAGVKVSNKNN